MADKKITDLSDLSTPANDDLLPIVDVSASETKKITYANLTTPRFVPLATPLLSVAWDGDARSNTTSVIIDLSVIFGAPAGIKAIACRFTGRDSVSYPSGTPVAAIGPSSLYDSIVIYPKGGDYFESKSGICICDANGDICFRCTASGSLTLDIYLEIWGYWI